MLLGEIVKILQPQQGYSVRTSKNTPSNVLQALDQPSTEPKKLPNGAYEYLSIFHALKSSIDSF